MTPLRILADVALADAPSAEVKAVRPPPPNPDAALVDAPSAEEVNEQNYLDAFEKASLMLVEKRLPLIARRHGVRMLQHLVDFRMVELGMERSARHKALVGSLDLILKGATTTYDPAAESKENKNKFGILALATKKHTQSVAAMGTNNVIGQTTEKEGNLNPESGISSGSSSGDSSTILNEVDSSSTSEDYDYVPVMNNGNNIGDMVDITNACKEFLEFLDPRMLACREMISGRQGKVNLRYWKGSLLHLEHNILCQAFLIVISYSGIHQCEKMLPMLLGPLNKIWSFPLWKCAYLHHGSGLSRLFSDSEFLKMVYFMVVICEEQLKSIRTKESIEPYILILLQSMLPLVLHLIQCLHGLWDQSIACNLSEDLERAKYPDSLHPFECATKLTRVKKKKYFKANEAQALLLQTRALLEGVRESGYNLIGLCASIGGALSKLLDDLPVSVAVTKYLGSLEFRHLRKLIQLTVIPLVKNCPSMFLKGLADNLLGPLLTHCERLLHSAWFTLLYRGRAEVHFYFGKLSGLDNTVRGLERDILLEFTREVAGLLEVLALTEQNAEYGTYGNKTVPFEDIDSVASTSLFRYLLTNDCFGRLRVGLFGYFLDGQATSKAIPFCRTIVNIAVDSNDPRHRLFILDNLIPCLIQRLDNKLPCAIQRLKCNLSSNAKDETSRDLILLCRELYGYMETEASSWEGQNGQSAGTSFEMWLKRQKEGFQEKACSAAKYIPKGHQWNWEFEDEFRRFLSAYIDMLQEVDSMVDSAERKMDKESLFQKLRSEFRSKYGINSCLHPFMVTISCIQHRKFNSMVTVVRNKRICNFLHKLIKLKPYIKGSDRSRDVVNRLKQIHEIPAEFNNCDVAPSVERLRSILSLWEPRYHPMIREAHMDRLLGVVDKLTASECFKPVKPIVRDFPLHLQPYAEAFVESKLKSPEYLFVKEQLCLHEEFDMYLASGEMDAYMDNFVASKDDFVEGFVANKLAPHLVSVLDSSLIKLSFERRAEIVQLQTEIRTYAERMQDLFKNEQLKLLVKSLFSELKAEGFFDCGNDELSWEKLSFSECIDKFIREVFSGSSLPKQYAIRGFIDFQMILGEDMSCQAVEKVVIDVCNELTEYLSKFWRDTRYYEHKYYAITRDPLNQAFLSALY